MAEILQSLMADLTIMPDARLVDMRKRSKEFPGVDPAKLAWSMMVRRQLLQHDVRTYRRMSKRILKPLIVEADAPTLACMSMAIVKHNAIRHVSPDQCRQLLLAACARKKRKS
ncbi:hypothetical protein [Aureimonas glaciei]|uniref:Uncharacterized protein n=1 Tax=Aureimonas glaciei TaxID=1776957 RepID=A0A916Y5J5_9HYPH|nr:hypothetical protein [Aureimonas glaciei]GGD31540.1 hypothetical protein GCM10011335_38220 [Aureimonas glaciei]